MVPRIVLAVALGGAIGLIVGTFGKAMGGQCPLACNPYISTALGVVIALLLASRGEISASKPGSDVVVSIDSWAAYEEAVSGPGKVTLIEFYTPWCPACRQQMPIIERVAEQFEGRATVATLNAQEVTPAAELHNIRAVPTLILFKDGQVVWQEEGVHREQELVALLEKHAPATPPEPTPDEGSAPA
jgi:thioredoxin 1